MLKLVRSPFVAALLGGLVASSALLAVGQTRPVRTTTVVEQAPLQALTASRREAAQAEVAAGLTARDVYAAAAPAVAQVTAVRAGASSVPYDPGAPQSGASTGSAFVVDQEGFLLTNSHVVAGASAVSVVLDDGEPRPAKVAGLDRSSDLALLKVDPDPRLRPLALGGSSGTQVGDPVVAIGNPFGIDRTLTTGVVSAKQRRAPAPDGSSVGGLLQTDAEVNPAASGGPLIDASGRVVGITTRLQAVGGEGSAFAVPVDTARQVLPELRTMGRVRRGWLGLEGRTVDDVVRAPTLQRPDGALVTGVVAGGPAAAAGLEPGGKAAGRADGDVIRAVDGRRVRSLADVLRVVEARKPGERVELELTRDGRARKVVATLGERPADGGTGP